MVEVVDGETKTSPAKAVRFKPVDYNPIRSDRFVVKSFHHVEFWCSDATTTAGRFSFGLGLPILAKSDHSTGNSIHASYLLLSNQLNLLFTAPYSPSTASTNAPASIPSFSHSACRSFVASHGLGVRAIAVEVEDTELAFSTSITHGAKPALHPVSLHDGDIKIVMAEVYLCGDVVLRYLSFKQVQFSRTTISFLPGFEPMDKKSSAHFGLKNLDHVFINMYNLASGVEYIKGFTGFHEFVEFAAEDVDGSESGMNSMVVGSNEERVLIGMAEPVYGTKRRSPIETFLEHNEGGGVQHLALESEHIFRTLKEMRRVGGFEFLAPPPPTYYRNLKNRVGDDVLSEEQLKECEELGILVDKDEEGTILQIFTKPIGDRPTIFLEIIQRIGCMQKDEEGNTYQKRGCGGFGKGNISQLFKSNVEYEKTLEAQGKVRTCTTQK